MAIGNYSVPYCAPLGRVNLLFDYDEDFSGSHNDELKLFGDFSFETLNTSWFRFNQNGLTCSSGIALQCTSRLILCHSAKESSNTICLETTKLRIALTDKVHPHIQRGSESEVLVLYNESVVVVDENPAGQSK